MVVDLLLLANIVCTSYRRTNSEVAANSFVAPEVLAVVDVESRAQPTTSKALKASVRPRG